jgi:hypothetical protein
MLQQMRYRFIITVFAGILLIPLSLCAQLEKMQRCLTLYNEIATIYAEKNYTAAETLCEQLIGIYNNEFPVDWYYANCLLANDKIEEAKPIILKVLNHNRFEKKWLSGDGFDKVKGQAVGFWIDSLCAAIPEKCIPMIDSLAVMVSIDQQIRTTYMNAPPQSAEKDSLAILMMHIDSVNTQKLQNMIAQYGFPTWKLLGYDGAHNAWLISQHADLAFQEWYLSRMQQAVNEYNASPRDLPYLIDRILIKKKQPQLYGTQIWSGGTYQPIEDVENLNNRRASMYLEPLDISTMKIADSF